MMKGEKMFRKIVTYVCSGMLLLNIYGCFLLVAGAVGGTGTAAWLSGKLTQEFHSSYDHTVTAVKGALESLKLKVTKETHEENVTQFKGEYTDGKDMWIDVRRVTEDSSKVEIRVGAVTADKEAATKILKAIQSHI